MSSTESVQPAAAIPAQCPEILRESFPTAANAASPWLRCSISRGRSIRPNSCPVSSPWSLAAATSSAVPSSRTATPAFRGRPRTTWACWPRSSTGWPCRTPSSIRGAHAGHVRHSDGWGCEPYIRHRTRSPLRKGRIMILAAGTGGRYVTTDTAAALRALELGADMLIKATRVDGVYSDDPERNPHAVLYRQLDYDTVRRLTGHGRHGRRALPGALGADRRLQLPEGRQHPAGGPRREGRHARGTAGNEQRRGVTDPAAAGPGPRTAKIVDWVTESSDRSGTALPAVSAGMPPVRVPPGDASHAAERHGTLADGPASRPARRPVPLLLGGPAHLR